MVNYPPIEFWEHFKNANGAMSAAEALFMYNACLQVEGNDICVEMGTYQSKSAMVTLIAWRGIDYRTLYLLEPLFDDAEFLKEASNNVKELQNKFGDNTTCVFLKNISTVFLPKHDNYSYIMWDSGDHSPELVNSEKSLLENKVSKGGVIVMHDINAQFIACTEAYNSLIASGNYEPLLFDWNEIIEYVNANNLEDSNKSWHHQELKNPCFVGAVKRK